MRQPYYCTREKGPPERSVYTLRPESSNGSIEKFIQAVPQHYITSRRLQFNHPPTVSTVRYLVVNMDVIGAIPFALHIAREVGHAIQKIRDAPDSLREISKSLGVLESILGYFVQSRLPLASQLQKVVNELEHDLNELRQVVKDYELNVGRGFGNARHNYRFSNDQLQKLHASIYKYLGYLGPLVGLHNGDVLLGEMRDNREEMRDHFRQIQESRKEERQERLLREERDGVAELDSSQHKWRVSHQHTRKRNSTCSTTSTSTRDDFISQGRKYASQYDASRRMKRKPSRHDIGRSAAVPEDDGDSLYQGYHTRSPRDLHESLEMVQSYVAETHPQRPPPVVSFNDRHRWNSR